MAAHYATDFTCAQPSNGTDCCNVALGGANGVAGGCAASARVTATTPGRGQINALTRGEESAFVSTSNGKLTNDSWWPGSLGARLYNIVFRFVTITLDYNLEP